MKFNSNIMCESGECHITSDKEIHGIEIDFVGKARITSSLPNGWMLRGGENKIVIISLNKSSITNAVLFKYIGNIILKNVLICNIDGSSSKSNIQKTSYKWGDLNFEWEKEADLDLNKINNPRKNIANLKKNQYIYNYEANLNAANKELYLNNVPYSGLYHIPEDTDVPMTGPFPNKNSKPLSYGVSKKTQIKKARKRNNARQMKMTNKKGGY